MYLQRYIQKNLIPKRDEDHRGTTLIPDIYNIGHSDCVTCSIRYLLLLYVQRYSSRAKFDSYLNQRKLTADDFLSLLENSSLLNTFNAFYYSKFLIILTIFMKIVNPLFEQIVHFSAEKHDIHAKIQPQHDNDNGCQAAVHIGKTFEDIHIHGKDK